MSDHTTLTDADREALGRVIRDAGISGVTSDRVGPFDLARADAVLSSDWFAASVAEALADERERIAQAIEHGPHRLGHDVSVVCSCVRCEATHAAARIAREGADR